MPEPFGPSGFILLRAVGAGAMFWIVKSFIKEKINKKDFPRLILCGLTGVAINQLFFFNGLHLTSPINASIIMVSNPIMVLVIASIILKNKITKTKLLGVLIGAAGAAWLIISSSTSHDASSSWLGDLFILFNAISYALYLVLVKPLMSKYKPITVITWVFFFGLLFVFPFGIGEMSEINWVSLSPWQWFAVAFVVIATTFFAYLLNIFALKEVQPTVASTYIYLQPVFAGIFVWLFNFFLENSVPSSFGWQKLICTILIFTGVYLASRKK